MNKIQEKINKVEYNRNEAIKLVRRSLIDSCNITINNIDSLLEKVEDKNSKQYKSLTKLQKLLMRFIDEIVFAQNVEELINTRKKLNYYITKVRKELENRQIDIISEETYKGSIALLRDDIKEYIRCFKRNNNIALIKGLYKEKLTRQEKKDITKKLSNERRFTKRILEKYSNPRFLPTNDIDYRDTNGMREIIFEEPIEIVEENNSKYPFFKKIKENKIETKDIEVPETIEFEPLDLEEPIEINLRAPQIQVKTPEESNQEVDVFPEETIETTKTPEERIYINTRMIQESTNYVMRKTKRYEGSFIGNISSLISNVPGYIHNKRIIELMKSKYANIYRGSDLRELIHISEDTNSFKKAIETIFNRTKIGKKLNKSVEEQELRQQELDLLLDIMEEYKREEKGKSTPTDFAYDSLGHQKKIGTRKQVLPGNIEYESIK